MFASRTLLQAERNYSPTEGEALAILFALKRFEHLVHGMEVIVRTDHRPLSFVKAGSEHNRKLARWWAELQNFNVKVEYLPGKKNIVADTLSRLTTAYGVSEDFLFIAKRAYDDEDGDEVINCDLCGDKYYLQRVKNNLLDLPLWYCE